jgi:hypothetical protein
MIVICVVTSKERYQATQWQETDTRLSWFKQLGILLVHVTKNSRTIWLQVLLAQGIKLYY